jgi:hypothetical protein
MKTHELIDNRDEAGMLLKGKEIDVRSSIGVIWNGISFEKMVIPMGGASPIGGSSGAGIGVVGHFGSL